MKACVLGTGVVGGILSACLKGGGLETWIVDADPKRLGRLREEGLRIRDPQRLLKGDFSVRADNARAALSEVPEGMDVLFVSVKACVLKHVLADIRSFHRPGMLVVSFQNGLDTEDVLAQSLGRRAVARVVINYAGRLDEDGSVEIGFFVPPNYIGVLDPEISGRAREVADILTGAGLKTEFTDRIRDHVWEKVILNSSMSPLSALTGLTMKEMMESADMRAIVEGVTAEGIAVARACGVDFPQGFLAHCMHYLTQGGLHKPSMLVDVEAGRETEIEFLNGRICAYASRLGMAVPHNATIAALMRGIDARHIRPVPAPKNPVGASR